MASVHALLGPGAGVAAGAHAAGPEDRGPYAEQIALELCRAARPGQTLVSEQFAAAAGRAPHVTGHLVPLGSHLIGETARPRPVYRLEQQGVVPDDRPPRTAETVPNNLPRPATAFVGRGEELREAESLLENTQLLTITGPPGVGKSRVALRLAGALLGGLGDDGAWFVDLAPISDVAGVVTALSSVLPWPRVGELTQATLLNMLASRSALLVLDNGEHLASEVGDFLAHLSGATPGTRVLFTSRRPTSAPGGETMALRPMTVPPEDVIDPARLTAYDSVALMDALARLARPGFRLDVANAAAVGRLCRILEGSPLAISLAAPRLRSMSPVELADRLAGRGALTALAPASTADLRQPSLDTVTEWSYELLSDDERYAYQCLSVFWGSFDLEAAESVIGPTSVRPPGFVVDGLVHHSLLEVGEVRGRSDYRMLETIRVHAGRRLAEAGMDAAARDRHLDWFIELANRYGRLVGGPDDALARRALNESLANLHAALAWAIETPRAEESARLALALGPFWRRTGLWSEARLWLDRVLALVAGPAPAPPDETRAELHLLAGVLARDRGDYEAAEALFQRAWAHFEALGSDSGLARSAVETAVLGVLRFDASSESLLAGAVTAAKALGERRSVATALEHWGFWSALHDRQETAAGYYTDALDIYRELGDSLAVARVLARLGQLAYQAGRHARSLGLYEEAVTTFRDVGDDAGLADALVGLANAAFLAPSQDVDRARLLCEEAADIQRRLGSDRDLAWTLYVLAEVTRDLRDLAASRRAAEESLSLAGQVGVGPLDSLPLFSLAELAYVESDLDTAAARGRQALERAVELGLGLHIMRCLEAAARVCAVRGQFEAAARLLGHVDGARRRSWPEERDAVRALHEQATRSARAALGEPSFDTEFGFGETITVQAAAELALGALAAPEGSGGFDPTGVDIGAVAGEFDGVGSRAALGGHWRVQLLGDVVLSLDGTVFEPRGRALEQLVKLVALRQPVPVDEVVEVLWPEAPPGMGRQRLNNLLARLRRVCGILVVRQGETLRLSPGAEVDVAAFEQRAAAALAAMRSGHADAGALCRDAVVLYRGELLPADRYEDWTASRRVQLGRLYLEVLDALAEEADSSGRSGEAVEWLERAIDAEPLDESRYQRAAAIMVGQGWRHRAQALALRARRMADELGVALPDDLARLLPGN